MDLFACQKFCARKKLSIQLTTFIMNPSRELKHESKKKQRFNPFLIHTAKVHKQTCKKNN